ncbi:MAG: hypothetical protein RR420_05510 [Anaerovoracaceae bacterium]
MKWIKYRNVYYGIDCIEKIVINTHKDYKFSFTIFLKHDGNIYSPPIFTSKFKTQCFIENILSGNDCENNIYELPDFESEEK